MNRTPTELKHDTSARISGMKVAQSIALCVILLAGGFLGGVVVERALNGTDSTPTFADLNAVYDVIEEDYYYLPDSREERAKFDADMEAGAIEGALGSLGDSFTRYLNISESETAEEGLQGKYGGVGVDVAIDHDVAFVSSVVPDSPADEVGIQRGDVIEQINGTRVQESDANTVLRMLRGDIGSTVSLTLIRPTTGEVLDHDLVLEEIVIPSVTLEFIEGTDYAWLRITIFGDSTVPELDAAIAEIRARGSTGVILDLRGNTGGWVNVARQSLGRFLDPSVGPAMFEDTTNDGKMVPMPIESAEGVVPLDLPMVVLIDGGTASAAEIVAGSLRDYQRATLVGQKTFGKGSVQRIYEFSDGSTLRVTVAEWFTPSQARIQGEGILPDVEISTSATAGDLDPLLDAGVQVLDSQVSLPLGTSVAKPGTN